MFLVQIRCRCRSGRGERDLPYDFDRLVFPAYNAIAWRGFWVVYGDGNDRVCTGRSWILGSVFRLRARGSLGVSNVRGKEKGDEISRSGRSREFCRKLIYCINVRFGGDMLIPKSR